MDHGVAGLSLLSHKSQAFQRVVLISALKKPLIHKCITDDSKGITGQLKNIALVVKFSTRQCFNGIQL